MQGEERGEGSVCVLGGGGGGAELKSEKRFSKTVWVKTLLRGEA